MATIQASELVKGQRVGVYPGTGWWGIVRSKPKGIRVMVEVHGFETEIGDVYIWDVYRAEVDGNWVDVALTPKQEKERAKLEKAMENW